MKFRVINRRVLKDVAAEAVGDNIFTDVPDEAVVKGVHKLRPQRRKAKVLKPKLFKQAKVQAAHA